LSQLKTENVDCISVSFIHGQECSGSLPATTSHKLKRCDTSYHGKKQAHSSEPTQKLYHRIGTYDKLDPREEPDLKSLPLR
jgi:hypothetical protein